MRAWLVSHKYCNVFNNAVSIYRFTPKWFHKVVPLLNHARCIYTFNQIMTISFITPSTLTCFYFVFGSFFFFNFYMRFIIIRLGVCVCPLYADKFLEITSMTILEKLRWKPFKHLQFTSNFSCCWVAIDW